MCVYKIETDINKITYLPLVPRHVSCDVLCGDALCGDALCGDALCGDALCGDALCGDALLDELSCFHLKITIEF